MRFLPTTIVAIVMMLKMIKNKVGQKREDELGGWPWGSRQLLHGGHFLGQQMQHNKKGRETKRIAPPAAKNTK